MTRTRYRIYENEKTVPHFLKDGKLISLGDAPLNKGNSGFLAVWDPQSGKMLFSETFPMGAFRSLAVSPDEKTLAIGARDRREKNPEFNNAYLLKLPPLSK